VNIRGVLSSEPARLRGVRGRTSADGSQHGCQRARAASHPDFNRRSRSSTGSAGCGR